MKTIRNFSRVIIAPVFIFSGFVKAVDPLGSAYKFNDYFEAFGMDFLSPIALGLSFVLCTAELVIGLSLLMGVAMRFMSWSLMLFMSFFTVLTFISALTSPVSDCGCFGDAIILTNWQTFWKNVIFMVPTLIVFYGRKRFRPIAPFGSEWGIVTVFVLVVVSVSVYNYRNLPVFDFRPYAIGTHIPTDMSIPPGAEVDEYEMTFVYAKDGEEQEFKVEDIPSDTAWKFVSRNTTLISKGYEPPIHDFTISTSDGDDITDSVLSVSGFSLLAISYNLEEADYKGLEDVNALAQAAAEQGVATYGLTASTSSIINNYSAINAFDFHTTDEITLKTIIRSNPGVVLLHNGVVVNKWHYHQLPEPEKLQQSVMQTSLHYQVLKNKRIAIGFYLLLLVSVFALLLLMVKANDK